METKNNPLEAVEIARRQLTIFFVVDTSGSMGGCKIGAVNTAIREVLPELSEIAGNNADSNIRVACLEFSSGCKWVFPPTAVESLTWNDLGAEGSTDIGSAFRELDNKLSRNAFLSSPTGNFAPVIFLMSDGQPTDGYQKELKQLQENKWFKYAIRAAVAIGEDADKNVLADFTGNMELVLTAHNPEALKKIIRFVSVTSSKIGSQSCGIGVGTKTPDTQVKQAAMAEQVMEFKEDNTDLETLTEGF